MEVTQYPLSHTCTLCFIAALGLFCFVLSLPPVSPYRLVGHGEAASEASTSLVFYLSSVIAINTRIPVFTLVYLVMVALGLHGEAPLDGLNSGRTPTSLHVIDTWGL